MAATAAAAPSTPGRWFGFGFNRFGQTVPGVAADRVLEPGQLAACGSGPRPGHSKDKVCPAWSHSAGWRGDGSIHFWGFVADGPRHQIYINNRDQQRCRDILTSEKYLLTLWQDRVECWDVPSLCPTVDTMGSVIWTKHLQEEENPNTAFPLIPGGYITTTPPFYKPLSPRLQARRLALGGEHALLLTFDWTLYSWGSGRHGQLGHGSVEDEAEPRVVEALHGLAMAEIAAGTWHSICTNASGDVYVWGWNESGQLGLPTKLQSGEEHQQLSLQTGPSGEGAEICSPALKEAGEGNIGNVNVFISIQAFPALLDFPGELEMCKVSCGSRHTAAVTRCGKLYTWGWGNYGQLGHGQTDSSDVPRLVEYFTENHLGVMDVVCGPWNTFVFAQGGI
ncbi:RCC1 domain-containing protein 1 isoform X1 [Leucoraja erinacea]|uniref:RCC1 domain-containing protein 1 isoform X1 n=1 Tax=Leucoraja erinaceus TaxID=7782 RepID=UPI002456454E|nr:RCC1 domain-containing protein 1 isoform X1 [Leucoraja erinacea]